MSLHVRLRDNGDSWTWSVHKGSGQLIDTGYSTSIEDALDASKRATLIYHREASIPDEVDEAQT